MVVPEMQPHSHQLHRITVVKWFLLLLILLLYPSALPMGDMLHL